MTSNLPQFIFGVEALGLDNQHDYVAHLPASLHDREALFAALQQSIGLPEYFGQNWDALSECLRDLSWIKQRRVVLLHEGVPQLDPQSLKVYLEVLSECVRDWRPNEEHQFVVVFPRDADNRINEMLAQ